MKEVRYLIKPKDSRYKKDFWHIGKKYDDFYDGFRIRLLDKGTPIYQRIDSKHDGMEKKVITEITKEEYLKYLKTEPSIKVYAEMYISMYYGVELFYEVIDTKMGNKRKVLLSTEAELGKDDTDVYLEGMNKYFHMKEVGEIPSREMCRRELEK